MLIPHTPVSCFQLRRLPELDMVSTYLEILDGVFLPRCLSSLSNKSKLSASTVFFGKDFKSLLLHCMKDHLSFAYCLLASLDD